ncbi:patched domain-containing protein [Chloropicon primus]|uniref:Patched domain-containing protein n=1 Tax=Chloropicon primus TaxID=1764295 RepID=A0A5B8MMM0_9CHLO|nr:patched domain-containing protein [Chloropicon primus]UPR00965.1 patched domain-containing protein [Chloropicon primus]|eukprot:QDZ21743.1 patched domain-containing protein [Chloropicon primus]
MKVDEEGREGERQVGRLGRWMGFFGLQVAKRPVFVIALMTLLTCLAAVGFVRIKIISDGIKLWVPQDSKAMFDRSSVTQIFDTHKNFVFLNIVPTGEHHSLLYSEAFDESIRLHDVVSTEAKDGLSRSYKDLCLKMSWADTCYFSGSKYLDLGNANITLFQNNIEQEIKSELFTVVTRAHTDTTLALRNVKSCGSPHQRRMDISGLVGDYVDCKVLKLGYALADGVDPVHVAEWFAAVEGMTEDFNKRARYSKAYVFHRLSLDQAIQQTVLGDLHLMVTCFILMISTSVFMLIKFRYNPARPALFRYFVDWKSSRVFLGCIAVVNVALSIAGGYGIAVGVVGVEFNTLCAILPFILVGIGVDDAFVLVCGLDKATQKLKYEPLGTKTYKEITCDRIKETMTSVGPTVTATSLTNIIAFLLGSVTAIPALRSFCIYAGICILCDYIMQVTFFLSVMTLFEYRQVKRYMAQRARAEKNASAEECSTSSDKAAAVSPKKQREEIYSVFDIFGWFFSEFLGPLVTKGFLFRAAVILSAAACAAVSIYGVMNIQQGLPLKDLTTIGSNLYTYFELEENSFENQVGPETALYFIGDNDCKKRSIDIAKPMYQQKLLDSHRYIVANSKHIKFTQQTWLEELIRFADKNSTLVVDLGGEKYVEENHFYPTLSNFLNSGVYSEFSNDLRIAKSECSDKLEVISSRFHYSHAPTGKDYGIRKKALREIRTLEKECQEMYWKDVEGANIFLYGLEYLFWEQDAVLLKECLLSLGLAVAGVFIVSVAIIGFHFTPIIVIVTAITLVDLYLFGFLYLLGLRFNAVTVVNLVMAVGLSIDYSLHIAHSCLDSADGRGTNPVEYALKTIGPAVLAGGISTFMGILPLAGSTTFIFKMFFKLMGGTVVFGMFVSLFLLPTLLSLSHRKSKHQHPDPGNVLG